QVGGAPPSVHRDEGPAPARQRVHAPGDELLAGARFAADEDRNARGSDLRKHGELALEGGRERSAGAGGGARELEVDDRLGVAPEDEEGRADLDEVAVAELGAVDAGARHPRA